MKSTIGNTAMKSMQSNRPLMKQGYSQDEAHRNTSAKYDFAKEATQYYDKTK